MQTCCTRFRESTWSCTSHLTRLAAAAVALAVGFPLLGYPFALLIWVSLDIALHPPDPRTGKRAI